MFSQKATKNQYSQEFKTQVLEVLENSPKNMAQVAKEFGVAYPNMIKWKNSKEQRKLQNSKENLDETKKLKIENERLKKENEILKKAATFLCKAVRLKYEFILQEKQN